jgi:hypothetical protein
MERVEALAVQFGSHSSGAQPKRAEPITMKHERPQSRCDTTAESSRDKEAHGGVKTRRARSLATKRFASFVVEVARSATVCAGHFVAIGGFPGELRHGSNGKVR